MCEPLRGKIANPHDSPMDNVIYVDDVKSAVEFYRRYANCLDRTSNILKREQLGVYQKWKQHKRMNKDAWYMDWLYDYCFQDMIDK